MHAHSQTLCSLYLLLFTAFVPGHEIVQHVHLSSADAGHTWVAPAPAATTAVHMRNIATRFGYGYEAENINPDAGMLYGGSFWVEHVVTHSPADSVDNGFFGGSQTGTSCGMHPLEPFDGIADYAGPSGDTVPASFTTNTWPEQSVGSPAPFKRHRPGELHELFYSPQYEATWSFESEAGAVEPDWPTAVDWQPTSALDFDLVYVLP